MDRDKKMNQLKKLILKRTICLYFSEIWCLEFHQLFLPLTYLIVLFESDIYVNMVLLICVILHKFMIDTYITDRFLSVLLVFITIITNIFSLKFIYSIFFFIIVKNTIDYKRIKEKRDAESNYYNIIKEFMNTYPEQENTENFYSLDDDDESYI